MQAIKEIRRADRDHRLTEPLFLFAERAFDALQLVESAATLPASTDNLSAEDKTSARRVRAIEGPWKALHTLSILGRKNRDWPGV